MVSASMCPCVGRVCRVCFEDGIGKLELVLEEEDDDDDDDDDDEEEEEEEETWVVTHVLWPWRLLAGYYSTPENASQATRTGQQSCTQGEYCSAGVRLQCAAGYYSTSISRPTPCDVPCPAGTMLEGLVGLGRGVRVGCEQRSVYCRETTVSNGVIVLGVRLLFGGCLP